MNRKSHSRGKSRSNNRRPHHKRKNNNFRRQKNNSRGPKKQKIDVNRFIKSAKPVQEVIYEPRNTFVDFDLNPILQRNLVTRGFNKPTKIQDQAIAIALQGKDIVGIANTGTGKTAAFLLPLLTNLVKNRDKKALVIAPTRELAQQIKFESREFSRQMGIFDCLLIGGVPQRPQLRDLVKNPNIVIGTPGRIKDHMNQGTLTLEDFEYIVLDEVDRMLDMGFVKDITEILQQMPNKRQSLFFSATIDKNIERLINNFTNNPISIMARTAETSDNVEQSVVRYNERSEKLDKLHEILQIDVVQKTLIFCETKRMTQTLADKLEKRGYKSEAMHGDKSQRQRQRALRNFKEGHASILVATDVAARGIDVDGISHVINYDTPQSYDDYTHRIGRTGRGNNIGYAITFVG